MPHQLHDLSRDPGPDGLQPFLSQSIELCLSTGLDPGVTNGSEHGVLLSFQQPTIVTPVPDRVTRFSIQPEPVSSAQHVNHVARRWR
jgi:hypothetical protein